MKLLIDESLARHVATLLVEAGHDAVHVAERELLGAHDEAVLATANQEGRALVTADTDFGTLLALTSTARPSVILLRRPGRRAQQRADAVLSATSAAGADLEHGAMVVVEPDRLRVRALPITSE